MALAGPTRFYDTSPSLFHRNGDIWSNLPTYGLLKCDTAPGLIITPACDLANDKVESLTYLPIIPIRNWLLTRCFYSELRSTMLGLLESVNFIQGKELVPSNEFPTAPDVARLADEISKLETIKNSNLTVRIRSGLNHLSSMMSGTSSSADMQSLSVFFGKNIDRILQRIVRNSFANDIHFLPPDNNPVEWSVIKEPSLVLFRYPLTAPIEVFNSAQDIHITDWAAQIDSLSIHFLTAREFAKNRPLKVLVIESHFMHDLLTRFICLYARIGSPDFSDDTISRFISNITGGK